MPKENIFYHDLEPESQICFPVTQEVVTKTLERITKLPDREFVYHLQRMDVENPQLVSAVRIWSQPPMPTDKYIEGAVWTYAILREQALARKTSLPEVTSQTLLEYQVSLANRIPDGNGFGFLAEQEFQLLTIAEPELAKGIQTI